MESFFLRIGDCFRPFDSAKLSQNDLIEKMRRSHLKWFDMLKPLHYAHTRFSGGGSSMADVIGLEEKMQKKRRRMDQERAKKAVALLKVFECASCHLKCARCGIRLEVSQVHPPASGIPYRFCNSCQEEFSEFQRRVSRGSSGDIYWYNAEWLDMWRAWTTYQDCIKRFLNSKEVIRLRYELRRG